ncbi:MAG: hypothetical protein ABSA71_02835 [Desulfomonilia bacterium]
MYNKKILALLWTTVFLLSTVFLNAYAAENKVGVVLLHGKGGTPATPSVSEPASNLKRNGFMVVTPEMSYSKWIKVKAANCRILPMSIKAIHQPSMSQPKAI